MSTIIILTPIIYGSWPAITAAVAGAAVGLGLVVKQEVDEELAAAQVENQQAVEVELENSEVLAQNLATDKEIVLVKDGIELRVSRDSRGRCKVCAAGKGYSKAELKNFAEEFTQKMTQCFVYNRTVSELKSKEFQIVNEEMMEDGTVRINVRRWAD